MLRQSSSTIKLLHLINIHLKFKSQDRALQQRLCCDQQSGKTQTEAPKASGEEILERLRKTHSVAFLSFLETNLYAPFRLREVSARNL